MSLSPEVLLSEASREKCIAKLKELPVFTYPKSKQYKHKASILVPLFVQDGEVHLLYTVRSSDLKAHGGQVVFPGGKVEGNESVIETALREAEEEIGISANSVEIWSAMSPVQVPEDVLVTPVIGIIKDFDIKKLHPSIQEVKEILTVPISVLCNAENQGHLMDNRVPYPSFVYGKHIIFGNPGIVTHRFLTCFLPSDVYQYDFMRKNLTFKVFLFYYLFSKL